MEHHDFVSKIYVLDGIVSTITRLTPGNYEVRSPNIRHSGATTAPGEGCLSLVINSGRDEFLP